jgi:hypothetical protein
MCKRNIVSDRPGICCRTACAALCCVAIGLPVAAQSPSAESSARPTAESPAVTAKQIQGWIHDLHSSEYDVRDRATTELIRAGADAVQPIETALAVEDVGLEVATRAIYILQELAIAADLATEESVRRVLSKLAEPRITAAARRASEALETLVRSRQDRALRTLQDLGAKLLPDYVEFGMRGPGLRTIEFDDEWRGTGDDLKELQWLQDIEQINFIGQQVTDEWMRHVKGMDRLLFVKIARASVTDFGIRYLKDLPRMQVLKLIYVPISDKAVEHLAASPQVRSVIAYGTRMTQVGEEELKKRGIGVDRKRGAFLGIRVPPGEPNRDDWHILDVTPGSAAEKGGLQPGDVIVKYGDRAVENFKSLQTMIADDVGGDTVVLQVRRGAEILTKEITFGEWQ